MDNQIINQEEKIMKSSKFTTALLIVIFLIVLIPVTLLFKSKDSSSLANPNFTKPTQSTPTPTPTPTPLPTPIEYNFDKSTDLKAQLQTVSPKTEDPNIDKLKNLIQGL